MSEAWNEIAAQRILVSLRKGCTRRAAALAARVTQRTFQLWMQAGKADPESVKGRWRTSVLEAEAGAELVMNDALYDAGAKGDWKAALEWLKRRRRDDYGDKAPEANEPKDDLAAMSDAELRRECQRTLERIGKTG